MSSTARGMSASEAGGLDPRYAGLIEELDSNLAQGLAEVSLSETQRAALDKHLEAVVRPALTKQLDALVGPAVPVIAEGCFAFNEIGQAVKEKVEKVLVCDGETVAVIRRLGRPEIPGRILKHWPGCRKHARLAMDYLTANSPTLFVRGTYERVFYSIVALEDARRELRQQELAAQRQQTSRRRWFRRTGATR
jgi:hypothetical protein